MYTQTERANAQQNESEEHIMKNDTIRNDQELSLNTLDNVVGGASGKGISHGLRVTAPISNRPTKKSNWR